MKKNSILVAALSAVAFVMALALPAQGADIYREQGGISLAYPGYYSGTGTNDANGLTNTAVYVDLSKGSSIAILARGYGYSGNSSNNVTIVVKPAFSSSSAETASAAAARIQLAPSGTTGFLVSTNVTGLYSPGCTIQLEDPATNPVRLTNVLIKVNVKTP